MNESTIKHVGYSIEEASAKALAAIQSNGLLAAQPAFETLIRRNKELLEGGDAAIADALGRQAVVLEALFYRLLENATASSKPETTAMALKAAMSAQRSLLTTLGAIRQLRSNDA